MKNFLALSEQRRKEIFNQVNDLTGLPPSAIEKDWWVTLALKAIFDLSFSEHIVFKGGTSLSKGWNLIERFSEDIDLVIDRSFLGYEGDISKEQVKKLRKASCAFISTDFVKALNGKLKEWEIKDYILVLQDIKNTDTDPLMVELQYKSVTDKSEYLLPKVLIEVGARSLMEPTEKRPIQSFVGENFPDQPFAHEAVMVPIVLPKRTFLEKTFLLHEEFQRPPEAIKAERKSRHLYDLEKLMDTEHGKKALKDKELYKSIVQHREKFNVVRGIDYANHNPDKIDFVPPETVKSDWEKDYKSMQENMIYGESLSFDKLLERLKILRDRFHNIK